MSTDKPTSDPKPTGGRPIPASDPKTTTTSGSTTDGGRPIPADEPAPTN